MKRPMITFALFCYNHEQFISSAIDGAFSQTYVPLEIIIFDDSSDDNTYDIINTKVTEYSGLHRIGVKRSPRNLGVAASINKVVQMASGELIVGAAGDDISMPQRVEKIYHVWEKSGKSVKSIFSQALEIDKRGKNHGYLIKQTQQFESIDLRWLLKHNLGLIGCTHAWHKDVFQIFGPLNEAVIYEDQVIPFRAAILGPIKYIDEPLVHYRRHPGNTWFIDKFNGNVEAIYSFLMSRINGNIDTVKNKINDLSIAGSLFGGRQIEFQNTKRLLQKQLDMLEIQKKKLKKSPNWQKYQVAKEYLSYFRFRSNKVKFLLNTARKCGFFAVARSILAKVIMRLRAGSYLY
jgi:glycosyltransferase involved in cell wall biosynthesis